MDLSKIPLNNSCKKDSMFWLSVLFAMDDVMYNIKLNINLYDYMFPS